MASVSTNLPEIKSALRGLEDILSLSRPYRSGRLGDEVADLIAVGIQTRTIDEQQGPGGDPLAPLSPRTVARKLRKGFPATIGVETGEMLEIQQVRGMVAIGSGEMVMEAGLSQAVKDKVAFFSEGDPKNNRPARRFYELDEEIEAQLDDLFEEVADERLRELGAF